MTSPAQKSLQDHSTSSSTSPHPTGAPPWEPCFLRVPEGACTPPWDTRQLASLGQRCGTPAPVRCPAHLTATATCSHLKERPGRETCPGNMGDGPGKVIRGKLRKQPPTQASLLKSLPTATLTTGRWPCAGPTPAQPGGQAEGNLSCPPQGRWPVAYLQDLWDRGQPRGIIRCKCTLFGFGLQPCVWRCGDINHWKL